MLFPLSGFFRTQVRFPRVVVPFVPITRRREKPYPEGTHNGRILSELESVYVRRKSEAAYRGTAILDERVSLGRE